ncbi:hypothetical protein WP2S18C03_P20010 (plasmid) [Aeromonas veronii]|nr:hypothetical protein WP2S18C03_P20010 [Aeromonas veronii]
MARQGITRDQVFTAADALVGDGQQPTINAIRERLGGTGSPNTIHKHLVQWREARPVAAVAAPELPQALTAAIAGEIEKAAAKARAEKEQELQQAQAEAAELGAAGEALEAERDELAEQVAVLTTERDTLAGKAAQQAADLAEAQQRIEREQQAAEAARVEVATARLKIEAQTERQTEQAAEIERLRAALAEAQQGRTAAEQQAAVLAAKLEACADRAEQIEQQAAKAAQAHDTARAAAAQEIRQAQAERDEARKVAAEAREQAARLAGSLRRCNGSRTRPRPPRRPPRHRKGKGGSDASRRPVRRGGGRWHSRSPSSPRPLGHQGIAFGLPSCPLGVIDLGLGQRHQSAQQFAPVAGRLAGLGIGAYQGGQFAAIVGGAVGLVGQHQQQALLIAGSLQAAQVCQPFGQPLILCHGCVSLCDGGSHFTRKVAGARRLRYPSVLRKARLVVSRQAEKRAAGEAPAPQRLRRKKHEERRRWQSGD